jgi:hypothetical protein
MAGFYLSPQVNVVETDLTTIVPAVSTNITVTVGRFERGPVNGRTFITNDRELVQIFGEPDNDNYLDWFTAFNFLQYGNKLYVTRVINEDGIQTSISGTVASNATSITVAGTGEFPLTGQLAIINSNGDREVISYSGKTGDTFSNVSRGMAGTSASSYTGGETVVLAATNASLSIANTAAPFDVGIAATGSITFSQPALLTNGDNFTVSDGSRRITLDINKSRNSTVVSVDDATDILTLNTPVGLVTGNQVYLTTDGTLPAGFSASTNYYVNVSSGTTLTLHTSLSNALSGSSPVDATDTGSGIHTATKARGTGTIIPGAVPLDISADSVSTNIDHIGEPVELMLDNLHVIRVVTSTPFRTAPFSSTSGNLGTNSTTADADTHFTGSIISTSGGAKKGIIRHIAGNDLYVQVTTGSFTTGDQVDNLDTFSSAVTQVISSVKALNMSSTYSSPTVTITNNNSDDGSSDGNIPIVVNAATSGTIVPVGMAGGIEPRSHREDYITRFNAEEEPLSDITFSDNEVIKVYAKSPGAWGGDLSISVSSPEDFDNAVVLSQGNSQLTFLSEFDGKPSDARREFALAVIETDPLGNRRVVEKYIPSLASSATTEDGQSNFAENVINNSSARIFIEVNPVSDGTENIQSNLTSVLSNSATSAAVTDTDGFPSSGRILIDEERIEYTSITATSFDGLVRGIAGTTPVEHASNSNVFEQNNVGLISNQKLIGGHDAIINRESIRDEIIQGFSLYDDPEDIDVNIFLDGGSANDVTIQQHIIDNLVERRRDSICVLTVPWSSIDKPTTTEQISGMITYRENNLSRSSSYGSLYGNWKRQYDSFNDKFRWLPVSGDAAGAMAFTDAVRDPWWAAAGLTRGKVKNVSQFKVQPNLSHRDLIYKTQINPLVNFRGDGPVIWGQKTLLTRPSAFDRINVRRLFVTIEKAIATAARSFIFEFNNRFTRKTLLSIIEPFLRDVQGRQGLTDFYVKCDEQNNPPVVVQRNELQCDIYIKPTYVAEFIRLNFIATPLGANFQELIKQN